MRTARSRTSGENLFAFVIAQSSQRNEPPQNSGRFMQQVKAITEQLPRTDRWNALLRKICQRIAHSIAPPPPLNPLPATG